MNHIFKGWWNSVVGGSPDPSQLDLTEGLLTCMPSRKRDHGDLRSDAWLGRETNPQQRRVKDNHIRAKTHAYFASLENPPISRTLLTRTYFFFNVIDMPPRTTVSRFGSVVIAFMNGG